MGIKTMEMENKWKYSDELNFSTGEYENKKHFNTVEITNGRVTFLISNNEGEITINKTRIDVRCSLNISIVPNAANSVTIS